MKKKTITMMLGLMLCGAAAAAATAEEAEEVMTEAETVEEEAVTGEAPDTDTEVSVEDSGELSQSTETEAQTEEQTEKSDFVEGSVTLDELGYKKGTLTADGWSDEYISLAYVPGEGISMGVDQNAVLNTYYERNGADRMVACSELVALADDGSYLQLMAESNPNNDDVEDILDRLAKTEELELVSSYKTTALGSLEFTTCTGLYEKEKYMVGAYTDGNGLAVAFKIRYSEADARQALLDGFQELTAYIYLAYGQQIRDHVGSFMDAYARLEGWETETDN